VNLDYFENTNALISCSNILEKLMICQLDGKFLDFYGTRSSLPCSQESAIGRCREPVEFYLHPPTLHF
jgi:hypothetical protein